MSENMIQSNRATLALAEAFDDGLAESQVWLDNTVLELAAEVALNNLAESGWQLIAPPENTAAQSSSESVDLFKVTLGRDDTGE